MNAGLLRYLRRQPAGHHEAAVRLTEHERGAVVEGASYTDFLVRTAADGDMPDLLSALLPCAWGYRHVARKLAERERPDDQRYVDSIEQYASDEFDEAAEWLRIELNRLVENAGPEKRERLEHLFIDSRQYEWMFWEMCWAGEAWRCRRPAAVGGTVPAPAGTVP